MKSVWPEATESMDSKRLPATTPGDLKPTDTHSGQDKYATTHQNDGRPAPVWMQLKMGANLPLSFGRYEVQRVLGEGTMAAVYLAEDKQLGRQVAIKVPKFEADDHAGMKRFFREARAMATLRHPHLCPVYDVSETEGVHYFTMAYIDGGTLGDKIESEAPMANRRVAVLIAKTAAALHAAHQTGTVHRDLKPANIMIDQNGEPVVMDFGLAGLVDAESSLTRSGEMIGTPAYMSPEQITGNLDAIGPSSDVYSLGAIMYEMLTAQLPYGGSVASVVQQALTSDPTPLTEINPDVDAALEAICLKAMSRNPDSRFASADELTVALRDFIRKPTAPPVPPAATQQSSEADWATDANRVRSLWRDEQFAEALTLLERLAGLADPAAASYAEWAKQEIPKVRSQIEQANQAKAQLAVNTKSPSSRRLRKPAAKKQSPPIWILLVGAAAAFFLVVGIGYAVITTRSDAVASTSSVPSDRTFNTAKPTGKLAEAAGEVTFSPTNKSEDSTKLPEPFIRDDAVGHNQVFGDHRPPPNGSTDFQGPPPVRSVDEIFADLDANKDGQLSPNEIPKRERPHLMRADTDGNGFVTREELDIMSLFVPAGPPPPR